MDLQTKSLPEVLGKSECYLSNLAELSAELEEVMVTETGEAIEFDLTGIVATVQVLWDKFKETAQECEGKAIEVKLPEGFVGMILSASLAAIGFKL